MTFEGLVLNGVVFLDEPASLPDGTRVDIVAKPVPATGAPTLLNLLTLAGTAKDLPADFAAEHDHYIHGTPRRTPKAES